MRATRLVVLSAAPLVALACVTPAVAAPSDPPQPGPTTTSARFAQPDATPAATGTHPLDSHAIGAAIGSGPTTAPAPSTVELVARLARGSAAPSVRSAVRALGFTPQSGLAKLGYVSVSVPAASAAAERARLAATPGVMSVSVAAPRTLFAVPNDPLYDGTQKTMYAAVHAPAAWDHSIGTGVTIAVLDEGFDLTHEEFAGAKVTSHWDVVANNADVSDSPTTPASVAGHGTATASVAAATANNGAGIAGSAWGANLMLIQVADSNGGLNSADSADGIVYATDHGAQVISMSYGGSSLDPVEAAAVAYAIAHGVVVVAAAGNGGSTAKTYPAADPGVISVGATSNNGTLVAPFSQTGPWVSVAAPGVNVEVAIPLADDTKDVSQNGYTLESGTSFSAPLVAGEAALLLAEHPTTAPGKIASIIATSALATPTGFAHGRVQFDAAVAAAGLLEDTVLTAPVQDAAVSGGIAVSATSGMPNVRFDLVGTTASVTLPVVSGTASGTLPSWGVDGPQTVRARGCDATTCGQAGSSGTAGVTVSNAAPVLTSPLEGDAVGLSFLASATATGGAVRFYADGTTPLVLVAAAPYSSTIDTAVLADGAHTISAASCTADGVYCDLGHPSNAVSITVRRLRPTLTVGPSPFSPNGDRRRDTTTATFGVDEKQDVAIRIYGPTGALVRGPVSAANVTGTHTWAWDGRSNSKVLVPDGTYRVELATTNASGVLGRVSVFVRSDRTKPALTVVAPSVRTFYPVKDSYFDTVLLGATSKEALSALTVYVRNSAGTRIRTLTALAKPSGRVAIAWDGRNSSRVLQLAGTYRFQVLAQDVAGNQALSTVGSVVLSRKHLVAKTGSGFVSPLGSAMYDVSGVCSRYIPHVRAGWYDSIGYYSNNTCSGDHTKGEDLAAVEHAVTLPKAIRYRDVHMTVTGGYGQYGLSTAGFFYYDATGAMSNVGRTLWTKAGTYTTPTVPASTYLYHGRELWWVVYTDYGSNYDIWQFHVVWTYYVLV
jgi:subtilisin family serine protease